MHRILKKVEKQLYDEAVQNESQQLRREDRISNICLYLDPAGDGHTRKHEICIRCNSGLGRPRLPRMGTQYLIVIFMC